MKKIAIMPRTDKKNILIVAVVAVIAIMALWLMVSPKKAGAPATLENSNWPPTNVPMPPNPKPVNSTGMPLSLPAEYGISIFAKGLGHARVLAWDPAGTLLVSIPASGKVVAMRDKDGDGTADENITVVTGLNQPHGLAFRCTDSCRLYIAETDRVGVYEYDIEKKKAAFIKKIADLPSGAGHSTRTLLFLPSPNDDQLLVSVGSACNVCREYDQRRAKILVVPADGGELKEYARGLRNAVFMTLSPVDGRVWATEMGRDNLGDDVPPDEINVVEQGKNYGWPNCYGKNIHDDDFDKNVYVRNPCMEPFETPSAVDLQAHSAPLGLSFFPEEGWPEEYWYNLLAAYHGSWNRSKKTGYKIVRIKLDSRGKYSGTEDFITGWLRPDGSVVGRPVDVLIQPGGTMYISDDKAGVIYRVTHGH